MISEERKRRVIDLYYNQGKTTREIAQIEKMSPRDIHAIIKEEEVRRQKHKQQEISAQAYQLFSEGKTPIEVAIILNLSASKVSKLYREYWDLKGLHQLNTIHSETNGNTWPLWKLYQQLVKKRGMSIVQVVNVVYIAIHKLPHMESLYKQLKDEVDKLQYTRQGLVNDIEASKYKISMLDATAFSSEQECKKTEQQVQQFTAKKDRLEKLIANILSGEGYSNLKQIVKENVKVVLLENRKLISISFVALIQMLKDDPEMIKLIQNMPRTNDGEQHKDNDNRITQYLEFHKVKILHLAEKNYENLLEALANNVIDAVGASSSSNPTLSLPQSSSPTFPDLSTQSYIFRIEESDTHHNSTGDITE